ncbi:MAG TPA: polysaccharide pyruvyl transferase family protein, partial [Actinomycetota bacterium]|nr:polysaccharide pyruvyl transferase family protein [Actinomycetota bacterium]
MESPSHPRGELRIGLWGTFDAESYGPALLPRIVRHELGRRLPAAVVRTFGILGERSPSRFDGGPLEPLGAPTPERLADLATSLDVVIVAGEMHVRDEAWAADYPVDPREVSRLAPSRFFLDGLGRELEEECPVLWHAIAVPSDIDEREAPRVRRALEARLHVSVRDRASLRRLRAAGVVREVAVVPDPTVLLPRVLPRDLLADRARALRDAGTLPPDRFLIVQGGRGDLDHVDAIGTAVRDLAGRKEAVPLVVETGHGDGEFAAALRERVPAAGRLGPAGIVDLTAAIAASVGFVGSSRQAAVVALSYGRPPAVLALGAEPGDVPEALGDPDIVIRDPDRIPDAFDAS